MINKTSLPCVPSSDHQENWQIRWNPPLFIFLAYADSLKWSQWFGIFLFEIVFSSHFLNIPTQFFIFLLLLGYQSLSGASKFQTQMTNLTYWDYESIIEKAWTVNSDVGSNPCFITCKLCDLEMLPDLPDLYFHS